VKLFQLSGDLTRNNPTSVHIVSHEQVVRFWNLSSYLKQLHQVVELAVNVSADDNRSPDWCYVRLFSKNFLSLSKDEITFSQSDLISASGRGLQLRSSSIHLSRLEASKVLAVVIYDYVQNQNINIEIEKYHKRSRQILRERRLK